MVDAEPLSALRERTSEKWREYPRDVLPMFVAEMDYPLAEPIAEALHEAVRRSDTGYVGHDRELPAAFAAFAGERWGWGVDPRRVSTATDVSVAIVEAIRLVIRPGDRVVVMPPVYPPFFALVPEAGGVVDEVPLLDDGATWSLDLVGIDAALRNGARAVLLCSPHNPLGLVHPREQLEELAAIAARHSAVVVSDEIHAPLAHPGTEFVPFLSVSPAAREQGITVTSASKAWNIAGLKCAMIVTASAAMAGTVSALPAEVRDRTGIFGRIASTVAFTDCVPWFDEVLASVLANGALLGRLLADSLPAVACRTPAASYLAWLDLRALGWGDEPSARVLEGARVALSRGADFGEQGRGFARLNFACGPDMLRDAVGRIATLHRS